MDRDPRRIVLEARVTARAVVEAYAAAVELVPHEARFREEWRHWSKQSACEHLD